MLGSCWRSGASQGPGSLLGSACLARGPACWFLQRLTPGHPKSGRTLIVLTFGTVWVGKLERRAGKPSLETRGQNSPCPPGYFGIKTLDSRISRCCLVYGLQLATLGGCGGGSRKRAAGQPERDVELCLGCGHVPAVVLPGVRRRDVPEQVVMQPRVFQVDAVE